MNPLSSIKKYEIEVFNHRNDYNQYIVLDEPCQKDIFALRHEVYNRIQLSKNNFMLEEFIASGLLIRKVSDFEEKIEDCL